MGPEFPPENGLSARRGADYKGMGLKVVKILIDSGTAAKLTEKQLLAPNMG